MLWMDKNRNKIGKEKKKKREKGKEIFSVFFNVFPFVLQFFFSNFLWFFCSFCQKVFSMKTNKQPPFLYTMCLLLLLLLYVWVVLSLLLMLFSNQSTIHATLYQWRIVCCLVLRIAFFIKLFALSIGDIHIFCFLAYTLL